MSAFLVATMKMSGAEAIAYVQKKRPIVCPNLGFRQQLDIFAGKHGMRSGTTEALFSPLRQIRAWKSAMKLRSSSKEALGSTTYCLP